MIANRRRFLFGAGAVLLSAPAIVRVASLMPVSVMAEPTELTAAEMVRMQAMWLRQVEKIINPIFHGGEQDLLILGKALIQIGAAPRVVPLRKWAVINIPLLDN